MPVAEESWMQRAACRGMDPDLFFPARHDPNTSICEAKKVCSRCPVKARCLAYAQTNNIRHGVWGGETVKGRTDRRKTTTPINLARVRTLSHRGLPREAIAAASGLTLRQVDLCRKALRRDTSCLLAPGCGCGSACCDCRPDRLCGGCDCRPEALAAS